jgi:hypothetical protein
MIKQDLWFTLSSGCAVAGLDWWNQDEVKRYDMWKKFYPAILKFTENIDFEKVDYTAVRDVKGTPVIAQRWPLTEKEIKQSTNSAYGKDDLVEAYIQVSSDQSQGYGWMSNRSVNWYNMVDEYPCLKSLLEGSSPYHQAYISKPVEDDLAEDPIDIDADTYFIKDSDIDATVDQMVDIVFKSENAILSFEEPAPAEVLKWKRWTEWRVISDFLKFCGQRIIVMPKWCWIWFRRKVGKKLQDTLVGQDSGLEIGIDQHDAEDIRDRQVFGQRCQGEGILSCEFACLGAK